MRGCVRWLREIAVTVLVASLVELRLRRWPLPRLARHLGLQFHGGAALLPDVTDALVLPRWSREPLASVDTVMGHWPWGGSCLRRCLVSGHRLRALSPTLVIGVRRVDGAVKAHAWLEIDGYSLDAGIEGFRVVQPRRA